MWQPLYVSILYRILDNTSSTISRVPTARHLSLSRFSLLALSLACAVLAQDDNTCHQLVRDQMGKLHRADRVTAALQAKRFPRNSERKIPKPTPAVASSLASCRAPRKGKRLSGTVSA